MIELEPDHAEARRALGYSRIDGQWTTQDELMTKRGLVKYKGQWKYPQEIEILENKRKLEAAQQEWCQKVKRWRGWLGTDRHEQGRQNIRGITDPAAIKALTIGLHDDRDPHARLLFVEALAKIDTFEAAMALAIAAIYDEVEEVRLSCLDNLQTKPRPEVVAYFVGKLKDKDNAVVNLAAVGLGRMKDPSAIGPLIDAVVTTHKFRVVNPAGEGGDERRLRQRAGRPRRRAIRRRRPEVHQQANPQPGRARRPGGPDPPELQLRQAGLEILVRRPEEVAGRHRRKAGLNECK